MTETEEHGVIFWGKRDIMTWRDVTHTEFYRVRVVVPYRLTMRTRMLRLAGEIYNVDIEILTSDAVKGMIGKLYGQSIPLSDVKYILTSLPKYKDPVVVLDIITPSKDFVEFLERGCKHE